MRVEVHRALLSAIMAESKQKDVSLRKCIDLKCFDSHRMCSQFQQNVLSVLLSVCVEPHRLFLSAPSNRVQSSQTKQPPRSALICFG